MLTKKRYTVLEVLLWTRYELGLFILAARKIWGNIVNSSRSFGMKIQGMARPTEEVASKEDVRDVHHVQM